MSVSAQPKNFQKASVTLIDGTGTPVTLVLALGQGDFQYDEIGEYLNEDVIYTARTTIAGLGTGKPKPVKWSVTALCGNIVGNSASAPGSIFEFISKKGAYSSNISTLGASRRFTCDAKLTIKGTDWGDSDDEDVTFEDSVCKVKFEAREEGNRITLSGTGLGSAIWSNDTNTVTVAQAA